MNEVLLLINRLEYDAEVLECVVSVLNDYNVPKQDINGNELDVVGRIYAFKQMNVELKPKHIVEL